MTRRELEEMREWALAPEVRASFKRSAELTLRWERDHPTDLDSTLHWIEQLRQVFGDPPVDLRPWKGSDFRL